MTEIRCYGCGAIIQSADTKKPGYVPESALSKEKILCQRCYKLMHYHQKMESHLTKDDFLHVLQTVGEKDCLVVYIVDLFDFNGSLVPGLMRHIGYNDVLVLANKRDILPKSLKEHRLNTWVRRQFKEYGIKPLDVVITSGKKNMNFDEIFDKIDEYRHGRDVYVVGITNVGKSTFINRMLKNYSDASNLITTSEFPGTTLDLIMIPLDDHSSLYDTPGIMNEHQYTSIVDEKDLAYIMPQGEVKPMIYQLNDDQSIFFSGLARIDYTKGDKGNFICYFSRNMQIHRTKTEKADELFNRHKQLQVYGPASSMKEMKAYEFTLPEEKRDIVISGLGFICIHAPKGKIKVYVPEGIDVFMRESLI